MAARLRAAGGAGGAGGAGPVLWVLCVLWVLWVPLLTVAAAAGEDNEPINVLLSVVEEDPLMSQWVRAAATAGVRRAGAGGAVSAMPVEPGEAMSAPAQLCVAAETPVHAVIGGVEGDISLTGAAAARAGVPLVLVGEGGAAGRGAVAAVAAGDEVLQMYPPPELALQAVRDIAIAKGWVSAALLHAGSAAPARLLAPDDDQLTLLARPLPPPQDDALLRDLLLVLKKAGYIKFVVCAGAADSVRVLEAAQRVGLLAAKHSYILASLELHTRPLAHYSHGGANITALMMFNPEAEETKQATADLLAAYAENLSAGGVEAGGGAGGETGGDDEGEVLGAQFTPETIPTALLLAYDAATIVGEALQQLRLSEGGGGDCASGEGAFHASTLLNYLRAMEHTGVTGVISWEGDGARRGAVLSVREVARGGALAAAGTWTPAEGPAWHRGARPAPPLPSDSMTNRTFNILIAMNNPYVMRRESTKRLSGNDRYEGFCIELIEKLAEQLNFNYTFIEQEDGKYGSKDPRTGEWNGMLRRLMDDENMHFAITDLTITEDREKVVDFTTPFMNLGIAILFRKPKQPEPRLFAFLLPFSSDVWVCLGVAYVLSSLVLYCVGRLCPEEWQNPYPCVEEPSFLENQFTLGNALWFNLGAVLLQGSEIAPVAYGSRAVACVWWFFALVITSSYTANLATLLAKKTSDELIHNVNDLAHNDLGISYGAKANGSTYTFFENSRSELFQEMFRHMQTQKMPKDNEAGIAKVMNESYAFLMESTTIEYVTQRNCLVYMVGDLLDSKGYGIAMRKDSPYRQALNLALLRLQESGTLREMKHVWWEERHGGGACKDEGEHSSEKLEMNSFYGLFVVLAVGCAAGMLLSCADLAQHARRHPRDVTATFRRNFLHELRFVFRFDLSDKPLTGPLIPEPSESPVSSLRSELEDDFDGDGDGEGDMGSGGRGRHRGPFSRRESEDLLERDDALDGEAYEDGRMSGGGGGGGGADGRQSVQSGGRRLGRRRSSMHTASMRLARHAANRAPGYGQGQAHGPHGRKQSAISAHSRR